MKCRKAVYTRTYTCARAHTLSLIRQCLLPVINILVSGTDVRFATPIPQRQAARRSAPEGNVTDRSGRPVTE